MDTKNDTKREDQKGAPETRQNPDGTRIPTENN